MNTSVGIGGAFDAVATSYDAARPRLVPCFDRFYGTAVSLVAEACGHTEAPEITDLGAGTGLFAALVLQSVPQARLKLIDIAPGMIDEARARLAPMTQQAGFIVADYAQCSLPQQQDAFISALSIHHLEDADKAALFSRVFEALVPGGLFVNAEQIAPEPPATMTEALDGWEEAVRRAGGSETELAGARERMKHDKCVSESAQTGWLEAAGFTDVRTPFRDGIFAVYCGRKPE